MFSGCQSFCLSHSCEGDISRTPSGVNLIVKGQGHYDFTKDIFVHSNAIKL